MQVEHSQRKGRRREEPAQAHAVSFITAVLMAVALCFHSILEVRSLFLLCWRVLLDHVASSQPRAYQFRAGSCAAQ